MADTNFIQLTDYAKAFSSLTPDRERLLITMGPEILPLLPKVTDNFYLALEKIGNARPFLQGRVEGLKLTHLRWLESLFTGPFDDRFTASMYRVGEVHVRGKLPVEFISGGITLINDQLLTAIDELFGQEPAFVAKSLRAVNSILGFCQIVMLESYQASSLAGELDRFLKVTGISRPLFKNLVSAYCVH